MKTATVLALQPSNVFAPADDVPVYMTFLTIDTVAGLTLFLPRSGVAMDKMAPVLKELDLSKKGEALEFDAIPGQSYRDSGFRSATERFALENGLAWHNRGRQISISSEVPGLVVLCDALAANNGCAPGSPNKGGYLKDTFRRSIASFLRVCHDLERGTEEETVKYWVAQASRYVQTFLAYYEHNIDGSFIITFDRFKEKFYDISEEFSYSQDIERPEAILVTLPGYLAARYSLYDEEEVNSGLAEKEIWEEFNFWMAAFEEVKALDKASAKEAAKIVQISRSPRPTAEDAEIVKRYGSPVGNVLVVRTDNERLARHMWPLAGREVNMIIFRKSSGLVTMMPRANSNLNMSGVHLALEEQEPGLWHFEARFKSAQMVMNGGGKRRDVKPTGLTDAQLMEIIREQCRPKNIGLTGHARIAQRR